MHNHRILPRLFLALATLILSSDLMAQPALADSTTANASMPDSAIPFPNYQPHRFTPAQEEEHWRMAIKPYMWAASIKGDATVMGVTSKLDVSFSDIWDALDYAVMGQIELQHGRFFIIPDSLVMKVSADANVDKSKTGRFGLVKVKGEVSASADMFTYFQELVGGYRLYDRRLSAEGPTAGDFSFDLLAGARYYYFDLDVNASAKVTVDTPRGSVTKKRSGSISGSEDWIDPLVGARYKYNVSDKLALSIRGDIGGFGVGSDLAWSATALGEYDLNDRWKLFGGYKVLDINYQNGQTGMDSRFQGPILGAQYTFHF